jgi:hypothetical protein
VALHAALTSYTQPEERRSSGRRTLRLQLPAVPGADASAALVYNLSERGLLLETAAPLGEGDLIIVELPEAGTVTAEVIWSRDGFAGCQFAKRLTAAAVSAALLRSDPKERRQEDEHPVQSAEWTEPLSAIESRWLNVIVMTALVMALAAATLFIFALISFPFSVG